MLLVRMARATHHSLPAHRTAMAVGQCVIRTPPNDADCD